MTVPWGANCFFSAQSESWALRVVLKQLRLRRLAGTLVLVLCNGQALFGAEAVKPSIDSVSTSRPFFSPTLEQKVQITFSVAPGGRLTVLVLDRDGYPVRALASEQLVQAGKIVYDWDGKDDRGQAVPDEAYSLKIDLSTPSGSSTYFPAARQADEFEVQANYYDRQRATLSYTLPRPARVHIQAGCAKEDPKTKKLVGPVLKTIANREPRPGGAVVDYWDGLDESGTIRVSELPNFVVGIAGTSLPENSILTYGNQAVRFVDATKTRSGKSLLAPSEPGHHHQGLDSVADTTPALRLRPLNALWSETGAIWTVEGHDLELAVSVDGPSASAFMTQPGRLLVFVDQKLVKEVKALQGDVRVPLRGLTAGTHVVAVNWASDYGPAAANALRVGIAKAMAASQPENLSEPARAFR